MQFDEVEEVEEEVVVSKHIHLCWVLLDEVRLRFVVVDEEVLLNVLIRLVQIHFLLRWIDQFFVQIVPVLLRVALFWQDGPSAMLLYRLLLLVLYLSIKSNTKKNQSTNQRNDTEQQNRIVVIGRRFNK